MIYDIAIIGAGASGLMVASHLQNQKVCLIDKNPKIGAKIKISGGSKCNITNKYLNSSHYLGDKEFIKQILNSWTQYDLLNMLKENNIPFSLDEKIVKGTYFCQKSADIINLFSTKIDKTKLYLQTTVEDVNYLQNRFIIKTDKTTIEAKKLIVASGGLSYVTLGATDIGFKIAKQFGHNIIKPNPALVGWTVQKDQFWFKELSGLSLKEVTITVGDKKLKGGMLFTHKGCSGPAVLLASLYWTKGQISIDFLPNKNSYIPKRLKKAIKDKNIDLKNYIFCPAGNFGYTKAEVTKGGVDTNQIDPKSMESLLQKDLYFLGEVLDVTGELCGYNLQWAFSSAMRLIKNITLNH